MNKSNALKFGNSFCVLPFLHQFIDLNDTHRVCCLSSGEINQVRLTEIQQLMLNNQSVPECRNCVKPEQDKNYSERQHITSQWFKREPDIVDKVIISPEVYSYDLRYSNLCNLRCQTCGPYASSTWAEFLKVDDKFRSWEPSKVDINPNAKRIYFAGGEPFMIKSFSQVLHKVENKDCEIVINTNATIITDHMLEALRPFTNVCFTLSIDGTGDVIEKIRIGCNWKKIQENIQTLRQELNPNFMVNTVLQKDNIDNIPELAKWIDSQNISIWHTTILIQPPQYQYKHYHGSIAWNESLWQYNCVESNLQAKTALTTVYNDLKTYT
jgi:pyruvate-formate lyase-activating enzyme